MKTPVPKIIEIRKEEWEAILQHSLVRPLEQTEYEKIKASLESLSFLTSELSNKRISIRRLKRMLFGPVTEKTRDVFAKTQETPSSSAPSDAASAEQTDSTEPVKPEPLREEAVRVPGHGRNGAEDYAGAEKIQVPCDRLRSGDPCPECKQGKVYESVPPGVLVRIVGQAPIQAKVFELQKLRCNLCGMVFTASPPEGVGSDKYDATAAGMIALLKYGSGFPFFRLKGLQETMGIPLPTSTQWDIVRAAVDASKPAYDEMIRQAARGEVLYNDDTAVKILELMGKRAEQAALARDSTGDSTQDSTQESTKGPDSRRGMFMSGVVSTGDDRRIALFFSGRQHAGENLTEVLAHRSAGLPPPIQMCDALSRNLPAEFKTLLANCLTHGRRRFVEVAENFPEECRRVLEMLGEVYRNNAVAKEQNMAPDVRLSFHQDQSGPVMETLRVWCRRQLDERLVEPNSGLGSAMTYLLKHWEPLTLFLRQPGALLDNNICERALKKAILHRKNAMFYKTLNGAHVGDVFMSLIHTCELNGANPFHYLTELQRHAARLSENPQNW